MDKQEVNYIIDQVDSKVNLLLDSINTKYSLDKYSSTSDILDYFDIDKPNFKRLIKQGLPVIKIGSRWKGKLGEIENWFKNQNLVTTSN